MRQTKTIEGSMEGEKRRAAGNDLMYLSNIQSRVRKCEHLVGIL